MKGPQAARRPSARSRRPDSRSRPSRTSPRFHTTAAGRPSGGASSRRRYAHYMRPSRRKVPVPPGGSEALPQGYPLLHGEVRDRAPRLRSRGARQGSASQGDQLRPAAPDEAEDPAHLRRSGAAVRNYFEKAEHQKGVTGENLLLMLERRLDNLVYRLDRPVALGGAPAAPPPRDGERQAGGHPVLSGAGGRRDQRQAIEQGHVAIKGSLERHQGRDMLSWLSLDPRR